MGHTEDIWMEAEDTEEEGEMEAGKIRREETLKLSRTNRFV